MRRFEGWITGAADRDPRPRAAWAYVLRHSRDEREERGDLVPSVLQLVPRIDEVKPMKLPKRQEVAEWYALLQLLLRCDQLAPGAVVRVHTTSEEMSKRFAAGRDRSCIDLEVRNSADGAWRYPLFQALVILLAVTNDESMGFASCGSTNSPLLRRQTRRPPDDPYPLGLQVTVNHLRAPDRAAERLVTLAMRS